MLASQTSSGTKKTSLLNAGVIEAIIFFWRSLIFHNQSTCASSTDVWRAPSWCYHVEHAWLVCSWTRGRHGQRHKPHEALGVWVLRLLTHTDASMDRNMVENNCLYTKYGTLIKNSSWLLNSLNDTYTFFKGFLIFYSKENTLTSVPSHQRLYRLNWLLRTCSCHGSQVEIFCQVLKPAARMLQRIELLGSLPSCFASSRCMPQLKTVWLRYVKTHVVCATVYCCMLMHLNVRSVFSRISYRICILSTNQNINMKMWSFQCTTGTDEVWQMTWTYRLGTECIQRKHMLTVFAISVALDNMRNSCMLFRPGFL